MNSKKSLVGVIWIILIFLLLTGCSSQSEEQHVITFDGEECTVSGPDEMHNGENQFILKNLTEDTVGLLVDPLNEGYTFQDLADWVDETGGKFSMNVGSTWPDAVDSSSTSKFVAFEKDQSTGDEMITLRITREGPFHISVINSSTMTFYPCAPLKVVEAPSE